MSYHVGWTKVGVYYPFHLHLLTDMTRTKPQLHLDQSGSKERQPRRTDLY